MAWATLVAILGTTISPYLFFWQASQEVEEEKAAGRLTLKARQGATATQIGDRQIDIGLGSFFSNVAMFFIIVTTASTLHAHSQTELATFADVAAALRPLAGRFAMLLYTIGIVGTGLLALPTLAGSAAYAFAETFDWPIQVPQRPTPVQSRATPPTALQNSHERRGPQRRRRRRRNSNEPPRTSIARAPRAE